MKTVLSLLFFIGAFSMNCRAQNPSAEKVGELIVKYFAKAANTVLINKTKDTEDKNRYDFEIEFPLGYSFEKLKIHMEVFVESSSKQSVIDPWKQEYGNIYSTLIQIRPRDNEREIDAYYSYFLYGIKDGKNILFFSVYSSPN